MAKKTIAELRAELKALKDFAKKQKTRSDLEGERNRLQREVKGLRLKTSRGGRAISKLKKSKKLRKIGRIVRDFNPGNLEI